MRTEEAIGAVRPTDTVLHFEEGLIGFLDCKDFVLMESSDITPFRRLQSVEREDVAFFVIDPALVLPHYCSLVPTREWEALDVAPSQGLLLVICAIRGKSEQCTGNLQAPILLNPESMKGRQVILTEARLSARYPLV